VGSVCSASLGQAPGRARILPSTKLLHRAAGGLISPAENRTLLPTLSDAFSASYVRFPSAAAGFVWAQTPLLRAERSEEANQWPQAKKIDVKINQLPKQCPVSAACRGEIQGYLNWLK